MNFRKYIKITTAILTALSVVLIILAFIAWPKNVYTGIIYLIVGIVEFLGAVITYPRISRTDDDREMGNRSVQQNWIILSIGIAGCALFLAPFFEVDNSSLPVISFILSIIVTILSAVNIYLAVKKVNARMVV